ncbi:MAG: hypothetical protein ACD_81C00037G0007 [uncultured bacterium]|uniref:histidine kinase n=2 Tax=Candidatus Wolfeibacteriota TaxID=1752735 RepID=A0A0G1JIR1_9BACT|nr:MAG: hypothetical protein ACD_81C00037G0007 [uncultured bacterium]KKR12944.1 MAG: Two-component sensor kinase [Candidatus Wolfebacteria bacterium GW2011_GWC2_39_22]KKT43872.1 MAG: Two-component sensor kinase [Candidatus Wolfebacteria bacterium GW2011_GWE2_44_13]HBI25402.1 hypothetical protein [Candidatus Wolfebacteria bacterium]
MFKRRTIGFKIVGSLAIILTLVIFANIAIFITQRKSITDGISAELSLINNTGEIIITDAIERLTYRTADFSSDGFIRETTQQIVETRDVKAMEALGNHLRNNKMVLDSAIYGINILDENGIVIASTEEQELGKDESIWVTNLQSEDITYGATRVSDFAITDKFNRSMIALTVSAPLIDTTQGRKIGTLINFVDAGKVANMIRTRNAVLASAGERYALMSVFITNKDGYIVDERYFDGSRLTQHLDVSKKASCGEQKEYYNINNVLVIGSALCINNGWTLITEIPQSQALQAITELRNDLFYLAGILVIFILLITYFMNRRVIDPIKMLALSAQKLGDGNLDIRANITSRDELGDLSNAFNSMAQKLEDSHRVLFRKIREVTSNFEKFKLAVEGTSDHVVITDKEGVILYANKAAEEITGYSNKEMVGNRPSLWGKQMPEEFYRNMWHTIKEERKNFHGEVTNKRKDGRLYIAETNISPISDEQGALYGFVAVERDITRQKEIDKSKTEFVSVASHQLRTPLTIINWYIEMLTDPKDITLTDKQRKYLEEIEHASKRMVDLVNALLNVSRIDMGTFMVDVETVDFVAAMEDALKELSLQIARKKLHLIKHYDKAIPLINADPRLLHIILQNLLTNAVKYTHEEGTITVSLVKQEETVLITVADTGFGIPAHQQAKIFTKFYRADNARAKEPDGNGLGLYIIKSLIESSGGKIWFTSEENKGTAFYVEIPLRGMKSREGSRPLAM